MEKETLLTGLKKELGEPAANGYLGDTGVTMRTLEKYVDAIFPTITSDEMADEAFYKSHAGVVKAMGGQMRFEQAEFAKNYKPKPEPPVPPVPPVPPTGEGNELYEDFKKRLESLEKERENERKTFAVEKMRSEVIKKSGELNVSNKNLWEDAVGMVPYTDDMDVKGMEAKAKEFYEAKLKSYFGEGASPYGGGGGVPPQDDKALDEFFRMKSLEGKFPKKE